MLLVFIDSNLNDKSSYLIDIIIVTTIACTFDFEPILDIMYDDVC